jgi:hypothetical protein
MNCGNVHDTVIEQHRLAKVQPTLILATDEADHKEDELYTESYSVVMRAA